MPIRTLIVDDEPLAIERLQILCARLPDVQLIGTAGDGEAAVRMVEALSPELLLLDIAMPGMTGLDVAELLAGRAPRPLIIFVTAFDQFAVAAFDSAAIDYLLKPVAPDRLERAIGRVAARRAHPAAAPDGERRGASPFAREFWVPSRGELMRVDVGDIDRIEAERDYMRLVAGTRSWLIHETIGNLEARLDPEKFARIHRSAIVALDRVQRLRHDGQGNWTAECADGTQLRIGRTYLASVRARIGA